MIKTREKEKKSNRFVTYEKECPKRFRGMFEQILGDIRKDMGRFRGMFKEIPGNV